MVRSAKRIIVILLTVFLLPFTIACNRNGLLIGDGTAPELTLFQITSPLTTTSPDITFILNSKNDAEVSAWLINESSAPPSSSDPGWTAAKPGGYTLKSGFGTVTVYARVMGSNGNISQPLLQTLNYLDPNIPRIISIISSTPDGAYGAGSSIDVTVSFSENVTLTGGNLNITLDTGAVVAIAPFGPAATASGTYTVAAAENSSDLDTVSASLTGGTLQDATGNNADLTLPAATLAAGSAIVIDTQAPAIASITSSTPDGTYADGANIDITITFSETVTLAGGTLDITLDTGDVIPVSGLWPAATASGTYAVAMPDTSADLTASSVTLSGGTLQDGTGNNADLTLPPGNNIADLKNIAVDTSQPNITSITSTSPDGSYGTGSAINVRVNFNKPVILSNDNLQIGMDTGGIVVIAPFGVPAVQVDGLYTVAGGETSADLNVTGFTYVGAALLTDVPGNSADLTLPGGNNLADIKALVVDTTAPALTLTAPPASSTVNGTETITFTDTEPTNPRVSVDNTSWTSAASGVTVISAIPQFAGLGEGGFTLYIRDTDAAGNNGNSSIGLTKDTTPPVLNIGAPSVSILNSSASSDYTVTYTGASTVNLTGGAITLNTTGTATCTVGVTGGTTTTPTVTLSACSGDGTVGISIAAGTSQDAVGNTDAGAGPGTVINVDNTAPTLGISAPSASDVNSSGSVDYTVTYTGASTVNLTAGDITLNTTGTATCTAGVTNGTTTTPTVTLSACTGDGTAGISITAGTSQDGAGNTDSGAGPGTVINVDNTAPTLGISAPSASDVNSSGSVDYTVTYTGASTVNLTAGDITLNTTGTATCTAGVTNGTTTTPTVTLTACSGDGTVGISIISGTSSDTVGNTDPGAGPGTVFNVDNTGPALGISAPSAVDVNSSGSVDYTVTYAGATTINLTAGDISLNTTGTATCSVGVTNGTTAAPTVTLSSCTGDGTVGISIAPGTSTDGIGNPDSGAGPGTVFNVDNTAPTLGIGAPSAVDVNSSGSVDYTVTYTGATAVNLTGADITLNTTGTAACTVGVTNGTTTAPTVTLTACTGDGTVGISIVSGTSSDTVGNTDIGAGPGTAFNVDNTGPTLGISAPSAGDVNSSGSADYTVTYTGATVVNLTGADITLNTTGTATCTVGVTNGTTTTPTVTLSACTGDGTAGISITAGTSQDGAGNTDSGAGPGTVINVDNTVPTLGISAPSAGDVNSSGSVDYTVTYTGASTVNLTAGDITLNTTGTATCTAGVTNGTTTTPTVTLSACSGDGTVGISIAAGTSNDIAGNTDPGAGPGTVLNVDNTGPALGISAPSAVDVNSSGSVDYTVTYAGATTINLTAGDISLNTTGTATCSVGVTNGTTATPTVTLSSCTGDGTVGISIAPGTSTDGVGNSDPGAGPGSTFNADNTGPTLGISAPSATAVNSSGSVDYTLSYTGATTVNLTGGDITQNTTGTATCSVGVTNGTTTTPTVTLSACTGDGTVGITVAAGRSTDAAGNPDAGAGPSTTFNGDNTQPSLSFSLSTSNPTNQGSFTVTFNFTEDVTGFDTTDVSVTNGTKGTFSPITASQYTLVVNPAAEGTVTTAVAASAAGDTAGNLSFGNSLNVSYDITAPVAAINSPASSATIDGTSVITFVSNEASVTEVSVDGGSNWTAVVSGVTGFYDITGYLGQADGPLTLDLRATDPAGNSGLDAVSLTKAEDTGGPKVLSVEYYDTDNNGRIDHAKLVFQRAVDDSTFDGFIPGASENNQQHAVTNTWQIAGYTNIRLDTGDTLDTGIDDDTLWLAFDEIGTGGDTGSKPDLTANNSTLVDIMNGCYLSTSSADCANINAADIFTADVIELDRAKPVLMDFRTQVSGTAGNIFFSESVDSAAGNGCDPADVITTADIIYSNSAGSISAITDFLQDSNGCGDGMVTATFDAAESGDIGFDSIKVNLNQVYDAADNVADDTIPATLAQFADTQMQVLQGAAVISNATFVSDGSEIFDYGTITGDPYPYKKIIFKVVNNGGATQNLELTGDPFVQSDTGNFTVTGQPNNRVIPPGGFQEFTVAYSPTASGAASGTITIPTNDQNHPYTITLQGNITGSVQQLAMGTGMAGDLTAAGEVDWYFFDASAGFKYEILWEDSVDQSGSAYTGDVKVTSYKEGFGTSYFEEYDSGYTFPKTVKAGNTERVYVKVEGFYASFTGTYLVKADEFVRFTPEPGVYTTTQNVVMEHNTPGVTIWYTTDGSDPVVGGGGSTGAYSSPVVISADTTLKAVADNGGGYTSVISSGFYETSPVMLTVGTGYDGTLGATEGKIVNPGDINWYYFDAVGGSTYMVTWEDSYYEDTTTVDYTADVIVSAYSEDLLTGYFKDADNGYRWYTRYITVPSSQRVYIKAHEYDQAGGTGDFFIKVDQVTPVTQMTPDTSYAPGVLASKESHWYSFDIIADREFRIYWDDVADGTATYTGDIIVLPYGNNFQVPLINLSSASFIADSGYSLSDYLTIIRPFNGKIFLRVGSYYNNTNIGDYELKVGEVVKFSHKPGLYENPINVTLTHSMYPANSIKYTLDGTLPTSASLTYTGTPIPLSVNMTLRAVIWDGGSYYSIDNGGDYIFATPTSILSDGTQYVIGINAYVVQWLSFDAVEGYEYDISWVDHYNDSYTYDARIKISGYSEDMVPYFLNTYAVKNRETINARSTGKIYLRIEEIGGVGPPTQDYKIRVYSP